MDFEGCSVDDSHLEGLVKEGRWGSGKSVRWVKGSFGLLELMGNGLPDFAGCVAWLTISVEGEGGEFCVVQLVYLAVFVVSAVVVLSPYFVYEPALTVMSNHWGLILPGNPRTTSIRSLEFGLICISDWTIQPANLSEDANSFFTMSCVPKIAPPRFGQARAWSSVRLLLLQVHFRVVSRFLGITAM